MTELETMQRAKRYLDSLANGINPLDGSVLPEGDIVNHVRISRCLFYVSDVLRQVIDNGGTVGKPARTPKAAKAAFALTDEQRAAVALSDSPIPVSELARRIGAAAPQQDMRRFSYTMVTAWLLEAGLLCVQPRPEGGETKRPTADGQRLGIRVEERTGETGVYEVVVYDRTAQQFVLDHLDDILAFDHACHAMQGQPWDDAQDARLRELLQQGEPLAAIARALQRKPASVQARIKKLTGRAE